MKMKSFEGSILLWAVLLALFSATIPSCLAFHVPGCSVKRVTGDLRLSSIQAVELSEDAEEEDFFLPLTPKQIKTLRKEITKRQARRELATVALPDSDGAVSGETLDEIISKLEASDLCQVRGISRDNKKGVFDFSCELEYELSERSGVMVERCLTKGHATVYFRHGGQIKLRTSYKEGIWEKREKAPRDDRGQIIVDSRE